MRLGRVKDNGAGLGGVYWGEARIYSDAKYPPGYAEAMANGPPFTYQAYVTRLRLAPSKALCA